MFRFSKLMSVTLMLALMPMAFLTGVPAEGSPAETTNDVCPDALISDVGVDAGVHTRSINCANLWGLDIFDVDRWDPGRPATRAELAAVLTRLLDVTVESGAGDLSGRFPDLGGHEYADEVLRLSSLGVINGFVDGTFGPDMNVRRDQMASMMMRLITDTFDISLPVVQLPFVDVPDGAAHRDNIARIYGADITTGVTATTYDPAGTVTRAQTITFTVRLLSLLNEQGRVTDDDEFPEPDRPALTLEETGREIGVDLATEDDPYGNSNRGIGTERYERTHNNWWDYTRHRLCAEPFRFDLTVFGEYGAFLTFDEAYEAETGLASCLWSSPEDARYEWNVAVYQLPRSEWEIPDADQCMTTSIEDFVDEGIPTSSLFYIIYSSAIEMSYGCNSPRREGFLIGDYAYVFHGDTNRSWSVISPLVAMHAAGYDVRELQNYIWGR